jgi:hypothetical protein
MNRGRNVCLRSLSLFLPLLLVAGCANPGDNPANRYQSPPPGDAATLTVAPLQTGFLFLGTTRTIVTSVDGKAPIYNPAPGQDSPTLLVGPGHHALLVRSFRDPVAAYACINVDLEKTHTYVIHTTAPDMDTTTMWIEDAASGQIVGDKVKASDFREPIMGGALVQAFTAHDAVTCPTAPATK